MADTALDDVANVVKPGVAQPERAKNQIGDDRGERPVRGRLNRGGYEIVAVARVVIVTTRLVDEGIAGHHRHHVHDVIHVPGEELGRPLGGAVVPYATEMRGEETQCDGIAAGRMIGRQVPLDRRIEIDDTGVGEDRQRRARERLAGTGHREERARRDRDAMLEIGEAQPFGVDQSAVMHDGRRQPDVSLLLLHRLEQPPDRRSGLSARVLASLRVETARRARHGKTRH